MKFFIKSLKKKSKMTQPKRTTALSAESVQLVFGGTGGDGAQPRAQSFSPEATQTFGG
ncbi:MULTISPECIES: hypothetical protein [unclassified Pseudoalteromonas]|uniref:hypothetical protein n=1 Tax=unclassified Pseudoalteromonas TaxID=194690 RepID=UPI002096858C|nr:hypothetical protein [Pseudoalteromonas sp. XMcav2-N]MCO7189969.1 hypothetical protein [Pseudoalteromonas sp. XMcav2-N]